ncbi:MULTISPECIES: NUDIX domain-containing protein [Oceanotoga]|uniref:8-oxo-dGTPase n=1 Tax=Oceanotoga teriensis TaxID=515440 RepID=A0AA45C7M8_9BACT|nr:MULTISPECIES: NUDIX hydrolase [Oceanotoga]MDN5342132.1 ADP-ribose pyrophosphatase [Oceanotoga sp.]MDO7976240.1 NUDIX hydrolase [Oceanotoga teriensis]PWJ95437.1 8-oxo-dGTPase [Oceanotoga teriensis]
MKLEEIEISEKQIFKGNLLDVRKYEVELPNGRQSTRELVLHPGAVAVFAFEDMNNKVILTKQHRFPIRANLLEIPAGKFDSPEEDPIECGKRELEEETGYISENWTYLGYIYTTPGFSNEIIHLYLAKNLRKTHQHTDEDEFIEIIEMNLDEFEELIKNGEINDAKTIAAYTRAKLLGGI